MELEEHFVCKCLKHFKLKTWKHETPSKEYIIIEISMWCYSTRKTLGVSKWGTHGTTYDRYNLHGSRDSIPNFQKRLRDIIALNFILDSSHARLLSLIVHGCIIIVFRLWSWVGSLPHFQYHQGYTNTISICLGVCVATT